MSSSLPPSILARLALPDASDRMAALETLSGPDAVRREAAVRLLGDPVPAVREQAARLLAGQGSPEAATALARFIMHPDLAVRNVAGMSLAAMGRTAVPALRPYLAHPDRDVRKFAIDVLAQLPAGEAADELAGRLTDTDLNVALAAVEALGRIGATQHAGALIALAFREPLVRLHVVAALGAMCATASLPFLEAALGDADPAVRLAAAEALAATGSPEVLDILVRTLPTLDPMARPVVLATVVRLLEAEPDRVPPPHLRPAFEAMLDDPDVAYRQAGVRGLGRFGDADAVRCLLDHAGKDDRLDVEILGVLGASREPLAAVRAAVQERRLGAQTAVQLTLGLIARRARTAEDASHTARFLHTHFPSVDVETRLATLALCRRVSHPALHEVIRAGLHDPDPTVSAFARTAVASIAA